MTLRSTASNVIAALAWTAGVAACSSVLGAAGLPGPPPGAPTGPPTGAPTAVMLAPDTATTINGVSVACTGVGVDVRADPRWAIYNVRVEFSNAKNEYLLDGALTLRDDEGRQILDVGCEAPWILMRLPQQAYRVEGRLVGFPAKPRSARFTPPPKGQKRVVLRFPDA